MPRAILRISNERRRYTTQRNRAVSKRRKRIRKFGDNKRTSTCKRIVTVDKDPTNQYTRTIYQHNLIEIPQTADDLPDSRQRQLAKVSGIKFCIELQNYSFIIKYLHFIFVSYV